MMVSLFVLGSTVVYGQESIGLSVDVISVQEDDGETGSRLDVFTAIPYAGLRFLKTGDAFTARYEVTVSVYEADEDNEKGQLVENSVWQDNVSVLQFNTTQSVQHVAHSSLTLELEPGWYFLETKLHDLASEETHTQDRITEVRDFTEQVSLSSLIWVHNFDAVQQSIAPLVSDRVFVNDPTFKVFYELYADAVTEVNIRREVVRTQTSRGLPILRWLFRRWQSDDSQGEISFINDEYLQLSQGRNPVLLTIPMSGFEAGEYLVRVIAEDSEGNILDVAERTVTMEWVDEAEYQGRDIDMAIAQLRYIAKPKELRGIRDGDSKQERRERFIEFWEKRDPTPGTPANERMEEYYVRIDYANRHYSGRRSGWETDRGHTLVLYGEPDEIDSNAADLEFKQPYEVWHYRRIGKRFIFLDRGGTGDFKLMLPTWNARSAIR